MCRDALLGTSLRVYAYWVLVSSAPFFKVLGRRRSIIKNKVSNPKNLYAF